MTKILNLDKLSGNGRRLLKIAGREYQVNDPSVEDFIETTRTAERLVDEKSLANQIEATVGLIQRQVPDIERTTLMALSLEQLRAVTAFVRGDDPAEIVEDDSGN